MADYDVLNDVLPKQTLRSPRTPTVAQLKAAIAGSGVAASYPAATMFAMTYNDLLNVCRIHAIPVTGTIWP